MNQYRKLVIIWKGEKQILERYKQEKNKPKKKKLRFGIPIKAKKGGLKHNNNHIERYNGKIKDRIKTMRGDFYSFEGAEAFMNLNHIIHNFVNPHQQLGGRTPAEAAEIFIPLKRNKLLSLIKYVRLNHITKRWQYPQRARFINPIIEFSSMLEELTDRLEANLSTGVA